MGLSCVLCSSEYLFISSRHPLETDYSSYQASEHQGLWPYTVLYRGQIGVLAHAKTTFFGVAEVTDRKEKFV
jgi:hypothetical protein